MALIQQFLKLTYGSRKMNLLIGPHQINHGELNKLLLKYTIFFEWFLKSVPSELGQKTTFLIT